MASRRLSRSLATLPPSPPSSTLAPPYSHPLPAASASNPSPSLRPPYAHSLPAPPNALGGARGTLAAPYRFSLVGTSTSAHEARRAEAFSAWAREQLSTREGRAQIWTAWVGSIIELEKIRSIGNHIPEISFRALSEHLASDSTRAAIKQAGTVVVRDVVADAEAESWARQLLEAVSQRQGRAAYWDESLVAARAHTSVLSANNQVLAAVSGAAETAGGSLVQADTVQNGIASAGSRTTSLDSPWSIDDRSLAPATPVLAHLALTPSSPGRIAPTIHAAIYTSLRPLFAPSRSKLSFYDTTSYLDPANWTLVDPASIPTYPPGSTPSFPHLVGASVSLPKLNPGDIIYRHASIPMTKRATGGRSSGLFLPITPLPRTEANAAYVAEQREAWEQGLPPPHVRVDGLVALENPGSVEQIGSSGGKSAMGY